MVNKDHITTHTAYFKSRRTVVEKTNVDPTLQSKSPDNRIAHLSIHLFHLFLWLVLDYPNLTLVFNELVQNAGLSSTSTPNHQELEQKIWKEGKK